MFKRLNHLLIAACIMAAIVTFSYNTQAQSQMTKANSVLKKWAAKGISFRIPVGWKIIDRGANGIVKAKGTGSSMWIVPWNDSKLNAEQVALKAWNSASARNTKNKVILGRKRISNDKGFNKYILYGYGFRTMRNGQRKKIYIAVMGFTDPYSSRNFYARFMWGTKNHEWKSKTTRAIANSFAKLRRSGRR